MHSIPIIRHRYANIYLYFLDGNLHRCGSKPISLFRRASKSHSKTFMIDFKSSKLNFQNGAKIASYLKITRKLPWMYPTIYVVSKCNVFKMGTFNWGIPPPKLVKILRKKMSVWYINCYVFGGAEHEYDLNFLNAFHEKPPTPSHLKTMKFLGGWGARMTPNHKIDVIYAFSTSKNMLVDMPHAYTFLGILNQIWGGGAPSNLKCPSWKHCILKQNKRLCSW